MLGLKAKAPPEFLGEGLGTTRVRLKAEAETGPHWHARVKGVLPAIPRFGSLAPQAERACLQHTRT